MSGTSCTCEFVCTQREWCTYNRKRNRDRNKQKNKIAAKPSKRLISFLIHAMCLITWMNVNLQFLKQVSSFSSKNIVTARTCVNNVIVNANRDRYYMSTYSTELVKTWNNAFGFNYYCSYRKSGRDRSKYNICQYSLTSKPTFLFATTDPRSTNSDTTSSILTQHNTSYKCSRNIATIATTTTSPKNNVAEDKDKIGSAKYIINTNMNQNNNPHFETIFTLDLPEGKCVGLRINNPEIHQLPEASLSLHPTQIQNNSNHWIKQILHPHEVEYGIELPSNTARLTFFIGRLAMRTALTLISNNYRTNTPITSNSNGNNTILVVEGEDRIFGEFVQLPPVSTLDHSILKDSHGRPQVPKGFIGSISHKKTTGVALISDIEENDKSITSQRIGIGVDIEQTFSRRRSIATKILTQNELNNLGRLRGITRDEEVLLRFSLKECVYKAMHPLISQWVGFQDAEVQPHDNGTATVTLNLKSGAHEKFEKVQAHWRRIDGEYFLTSSSVQLKD